MTNLFIKWLISALAIMIAAYLLPGVYVSGIYIALILALLLGFINALLRPLLILLTLPINILTLGLFTLVINGFLFWLPSTFVKGFEIDGFLWAVVGALIISLASWAGNKLVEDYKPTEIY